MIEPNSGPQAFVLSGGGAYAAYEVGVMLALVTGRSPASNYCPVNPEILTGTSAGAFNAAYLSAQTATDPVQAVQNLTDVWLRRLAGDASGCRNGIIRYRLDPFTLLNPVCFLQDPAGTLGNIGEDVSFLTRTLGERIQQFVASSGSIQERLAGMLDISTFIVENLATLIPEEIDFHNIPGSPRILRIAVTNWTNGTVQLFGNEDMLHAQAPLYVAASAAIPVAFPPVEIDGQFYVDGGVLMNTPLKPALDAGAGTLHTIYMDPDLSKVPLQRPGTTFDTLDRIWMVQNAATLNRDIETAALINRSVELIHGQGNLGGPTAVFGLLRQLLRKPQEKTVDPEKLARYRQVTIHRYHPDNDLGGLLGFLRFDRPSIERVIQLGYQNAIDHNCQTEGCITPLGLVVMNSP